MIIDLFQIKGVSNIEDLTHSLAETVLHLVSVHAGVRGEVHHSKIRRLEIFLLRFYNHTIFSKKIGPREAANFFLFNGRVIKTGEGGKGRPLRKKNSTAVKLEGGGYDLNGKAIKKKSFFVASQYVIR